MTIAKALTKWLEDNGFGTRGNDLFIGTVPLDAPKACWWVVGGGGGSTIKAQTGQRMKAYIFSIFYRNIDSEVVDEQMQALEELLNSKACHELDGYNAVEVEASGFQSDQDLDVEERTIGTVQVTLTVYQS